MSLPDDSPPSHEIIVVPPPGCEERQPLLDQCIDVRIKVFVQEQQFPQNTEVDEYVVRFPFGGQCSISRISNIHGLLHEHRRDPTATHFLLRLLPALTPIGTIRVYRAKEENYYKLSRLAVLKTHRRYGFGRDLISALHQWVQDDAESVGLLRPIRIVCHSQLPVKAFYSNHGYQPEGNEFDEEGAPHQKMVAYL